MADHDSQWQNDGLRWKAIVHNGKQWFIMDNNGFQWKTIIYNGKAMVYNGKQLVIMENKSL